MSIQRSSPTAVQSQSIRENAAAPKNAYAFVDTKNGATVEFVDRLIHKAHALRASDIHIDPRERGARVRLRIDGVLQTIGVLDIRDLLEVVSRIKVCARLRSDEHQTPQDGRFRVEQHGSTPIDVRVSITPTYYGENAVLRLLVEERGQFTLETLGFSKTNSGHISKALQKSSGMILSTGPTGSGKTTTLYSFIKLLNTPNVAIVTIEDPIEYAIEGIRQIQTNQHANLTFANGLRSLLRQDPDIIMVGEIRDRETAGIAVNTALTGHLLLSTLHTNDAATTLPRLLDMHIEPYIIASTVSVVIGQRLVRTLCSGCTAPGELTDLEAQFLANSLPQHELADFLYAPYKRGRGCNACGHTGFKGRMSINEVLVVGPEIRHAILDRASSADIKQCAVALGMKTILRDGFEKAREGKTTVSEIFRVIQE